MPHHMTSCCDIGVMGSYALGTGKPDIAIAALASLAEHLLSSC